MIKQQPVKINEEIRIEIISRGTNRGTKGDGIGKYMGFVIIVPDTEIGECYNVRIIKISNTCAFAQKTR